MKRLDRIHSQALWCLRDLAQHPFQTTILFSSLATLTALMGIIVLLSQTLTLTAEHLLAQTPAVVVRRIQAGGWAPLPIREGLACTRGITGALRPRVRIWGAADSGHGPVNVVAVTSETMHLPPPWSPPQPGQILIGPGVAPALAPGEDLVLTALCSLRFEVVGRIPEKSAMALHGSALVHIDDARRLMDLKADQASDLVLDVFHDEEIDAIVEQLISAMPWPVHITTRPETARRIKAELAARSAVANVALVPAVLALMMIVAAMGLMGHRQRRSMGLFKALGWTSGEIHRLQLTRGLLIGLPALTTGLAAGYLLLFWPGITWVSRLLFGWQGAAPALYLSSRTAAGPLLLAMLLVAVPFLVACFWAGRLGVMADPADLLEEA